MVQLCGHPGPSRERMVQDGQMMGTVEGERKFLSAHYLYQRIYQPKLLEEFKAPERAGLNQIKGMLERKENEGSRKPWLDF